MLPLVSPTGFHYRVCWGHNASEIADYNVEIESAFELNGPHVQDYGCTLGVECTSHAPRPSLQST